MNKAYHEHKPGVRRKKGSRLARRALSLLTACITAAGVISAAHAEDAPQFPELPSADGYEWVVEPVFLADNVWVSDLSEGAWTDRCAVMSYRYKIGTLDYKRGKYGVIGYDGKFIIEPVYDCYYNECGSGRLNSLYYDDGYSVYPNSSSYDTGKIFYDPEAIYLHAYEGAYGSPQVGGAGLIEAVYDEGSGSIMIADGEYASDWYKSSYGPVSAGVCGKATLSSDGKTFSGVSTDKLAVYSNGRLITDFVYEDAVCSKVYFAGALYNNSYLEPESDTAYVAAYRDKKWDIYDSDGSLIVSGADGFYGQKDTNIISWTHGKKRACPFLPTDGYLAVKKDGRCGYYDTDGNEVIRCGTFADVRPVHNGLAWVKTHLGFWGVIRLKDTSEADTSVKVIKREGFLSHSPLKLCSFSYNDDFRSDDDPDKGCAEVYFGRQLFYYSNTYNKQTAQLAAGLCAAAGDPGTSGEGKYISDAYKALGVKDSDISLFSYPKSSFNEKDVGGIGTGDNDFAFSIAKKEFDGMTVIMVVLRGTETLYETFHTDGLAWLHGTSSFYGSQAYNTILDYKNDVMTGLHYYLNKHSDELDGISVKYLVTGHSLGGAAANLTAAELDHTLLHTGSTNDIFAYTFGAINPLAAESRDPSYSNIYNIFNFYDTFGPHGCGATFNLPLSGTEVSTFIKPTKGSSSVYNKFGSVVPFKLDYRRIFNGSSNNKAYTNHVMCSYYEAVKTGIVTPSNIDNPYYRTTLKCPIDVQVINSEGEVVAEIRDNQVVEEHTVIPADVTEVQENVFAKTFLTPDNGSPYYFRIIGTGEGEMTIISESFSGLIYGSYAGAELLPETEASWAEEIKIEPGKELYLTVGGIEALPETAAPAETVPAEIESAVIREQEAEKQAEEEQPGPEGGDESASGGWASIPVSDTSSGAGEGSAQAGADEPDSDLPLPLTIAIGAGIGAAAAVLTAGIIILIRKRSASDKK